MLSPHSTNEEELYLLIPNCKFYAEVRTLIDKINLNSCFNNKVKNAELYIAEQSVKAKHQSLTVGIHLAVRLET